jgi:hypothetical protein
MFQLSRVFAAIAKNPGATARIAHGPNRGEVGPAREWLEIVQVRLSILLSARLVVQWMSSIVRFRMRLNLRPMVVMKAP